MQNLITIDTDTPTVMPRLLGAAGNALPPNISAVAGWKQGLRVNFIGGNQPPVGAKAKLVMKPRGGSVEVVRTADAVIAANDDGESVGADIKLSVNAAVLQTYLSSREALGCQAAIIVDWTDADGETCHAEWQFIVTIYPSVAGEWSQPATAEELRALAETLSALAQEIVNKANKTDAALGRNATAAQEDATAVGRHATATSSGASALGANTNATATNAISIGSASHATAQDAIAMGYCARAQKEESIAIGSGTSSETRGVAIGARSVASGEKSIAIGNEATVLSPNAALLCPGGDMATLPHSATISALNPEAGISFRIVAVCGDESPYYGSASNSYLIFQIEDKLNNYSYGAKVDALTFINKLVTDFYGKYYHLSSEEEAGKGGSYY